MPAHRKNYDNAVRMYESGMSVQDIAFLHSITRQAMHKILGRRGVTFRKRERFGEDNNFYRGGNDYDRRVHSIVTKAIQTGRLIQGDCESCGKERKTVKGRSTVHGHHDDYNFPLNVRWLCQECHFEWHKFNEPVRRTVELPVMSKAETARTGGLAAQLKKRKERHGK